MGGVSMVLSDLVDVIGGGTPKTTEESYWNGSIPWLSVKDFGGDKKYVYNTEKSITEEGLNNSSTKLLHKDNIIISARGTVGELAMIPYDMAFNQSCFGLIPKGNNDPHFVYYLLKDKVRSLKSQTQGSVFDTITKATFDRIECADYSEEDQRRIVSILSSLDRKIELNNKINADLEEMAQAIFKNWFVDFEPFKDGKFVDSELGMIPEGWKVGLLGELCNFKRGKNLLTKNAIDEGVPVVAGGLEPSCYHNIANTGAPVITVSGSGANAGFMRMYHVPVWASDCSFIDISCENFYFVYCFLKVNSKLLKHAQTGAVQPHVKPSDIHDFELVIPDEESIYDFQDKVKPFFDRIASLQKENSRLSSLRDTLLPRLMSGELEVPE